MTQKDKHLILWENMLKGDLMALARQSTSGGTHWGHHWRGERNLKTQNLIKTGNFDAVVLQNHSMSTFNRVDSMFWVHLKMSYFIFYKLSRRVF